MPYAAYLSCLVFSRKTILFNIKRLVSCLILWSMLYAMIAVPNIAKAQNPTGNRQENRTTSSAPTEKPEKYTRSNYKKPISFAPNKGQADKRVKFLADGLGYQLFLTSDEAVMVFRKLNHNL